MTPVLSPNTQAILLLTAPLIAGRRSAASDLLSPGEYKRLARHLREIQRQPADLLSPDAAEILRACQPVIDESRLQKLLARGFLLSQVIERWQARAIWVVSRADPEYPRRLKALLREDAPAVLYGCGDMALIETGGLAVVGSRHVDDALIDYTMEVGRLAARAGRTLVSGGAKGIDQAAMRGALEGGGKVCGVLADSLEKTTMNREHRNLLLNGQLVLISPYDPSAGFNVGNAMQRNKLIYALADTSLVVSSDLNKGGTWAGAVEQLDKLKFVPVFIRSTGESSAGLDGLRKKGALPWPSPQDVDSFEDVFNVAIPPPTASPQVGFALFSNEEPTSDDAKPTTSVTCGVAPVHQAESEPPTPVDVISDAQPPEPALEESPSAKPEAVVPRDEAKEPPQPESTPAEVLFAAVRAAIQQLLSAPMKDAEVAAALDVSSTQAKAWLQRLVDEDLVEKRKRPVVYVVKEKQLFD
ncbi:DNA-processing protein DprA [Alcaligenes nematophilus]|uniref:DNA-processing protein DprA n=1 Tax=Alcaligenes nematophilus TaxID=2994643 RepID=UPI00245BCD42|nr:DNA-processing protein DprA [Alcaligenes nematophilus]MDH4867561.1 DNA-processing protein DprA [Bacillus cereus]MDY7128869.1 DNA-processing protein DprA [Alcaligenes nematophilus]